ncbi:hypothetical protein [Gemmata sp.]|uniref:DNA polymerase III subunit beta family protein n=1 Tax=Gemmata sp. TaxID=1914242 RepID=UPI003F6E66C4
MRLTVDRQHLLAALAAVSHVPAGVARVEASAAGCSVTAAADGAGARFALGGVGVEAPGAAAVPLPLLRAWLADSEAGRVRVTADRSGTVHGTDRERLAFPLSDPRAVPDPPPPPAAGVEVPAEAFALAVARSAFAAARPGREDRWATKGLRVAIGGRALTLAATDTHHLAVATVPLAADAAAAVALVPVVAAKWWARLRGHPVLVAVGDHAVRVECGPLTAWTATLAGKFPDLDQLPRPGHAARVPLAPLRRALRMALAGADPEPGDEIDPAVRYVLVTVAAGSLTLRGDADGGLSSAVEVPIPGRARTPFAATLDGVRLAHYLRTVAAEPEVVLRWTDATKPVEVTAGEASRYVTFPKVTEQEARAA